MWTNRGKYRGPSSPWRAGMTPFQSRLSGAMHGPYPVECQGYMAGRERRYWFDRERLYARKFEVLYGFPARVKYRERPTKNWKIYKGAYGDDYEIGEACFAVAKGADRPRPRPRETTLINLDDL